MHTCDRGLTRLRVQYVVLDRSFPTPEKKYGNTTKKNSKGKKKKKQARKDVRMKRGMHAYIMIDAVAFMIIIYIHSLCIEWNN